MAGLTNIKNQALTERIEDHLFQYILDERLAVGKVTFTGVASMRENVSFRCMKLVNAADWGIVEPVEIIV